MIVRGIGPSLAPAFFPASCRAGRSNLELRDTNGSLLLANNDWQDNPVQAAEITAAGLAPTNDLESAIAATLPPGLYTALLSGRQQRHWHRRGRSLRPRTIAGPARNDRSAEMHHPGMARPDFPRACFCWVRLTLSPRFESLGRGTRWHASLPTMHYPKKSGRA